MAPMTYLSPLLQYYNKTGTDQSGRYITDIWKFSFHDLEWVHDFVQWLFPTTLPSANNFKVGVLTPNDIQEFRHGPLKDEFQKNLLTSIHVMFRFYGLLLTFDKHNSIIVTRDKNNFRKRDQWLTLGNPHNFSRFSRILRSLIELGMKSISDALLHCLLTEVYTDPLYKNIISNHTINIWIESNQAH